MNTNNKLSLFAAIAVLGAGIIFYLASDMTGSGTKGMVSVKMPELSFKAANGKKAFDATCAACHGVNAAGSKQGPPLIHTTYNPGHHNDEAFYRAVKQGVTSHHWRFGNMPPLPTVSKGQVRLIISFIREVQLANGIVYKKHTM